MNAGIRHFAALLLLILVAPVGARAQNAEDLYEAGRDHFREGRYEAARATLERAVSVHPEYAEAHYLLARLYTETPLRNRRAADRALDRALKIEPDNVQYLVANLQQLRTESWNFFAERIKEARRIELARRILSLDPDNGFAHEELGTAHIRDFWRYRNAVMVPLFRYGQGRPLQNDGTLAANQVGVVSVDIPASRFESVGPRDVFVADQFDLDALAQVGVIVEDLSARAEAAYERAVDHLKRAIASDPRRRPVYDQLMRIYALKGEYRDALPMLGEMSVFFPDDPVPWLYLGLSQYHLADLAGAAESFEAGLRMLPDEERTPFASLDLILPEREQALYRGDHEGYASRFWNSKDPRYLTPYNERQLEHYARMVYADLLYSAPDVGLRGWETERGRILIRYGLPQFDVTVVPKGEIPGSEDVLQSVLMINPGMEPQAGDGQGPESASILSRPDAVSRLERYRLLDDMNTFNIWDYRDFRFVFEDPFRNGEYRLYSPPATAMAGGSDGWINDYEIIARETIRKTPERYVYTAPGRQIELPFLVNAFKGEDGMADVYVHYAIPITEYPIDQDLIEVTASTGLFLIDDARRIVQERRKTVYGLRTDQIVPFRDTNLWVDTERVRAIGGTHEVSVEFESASRSTVAVQRREVEIPDFTGSEFVLSDMMLAYQIEEGGAAARPADIERDGLTITPAPWSVFRKEAPIYLYFEMYALTLGEAGESDYDVEIVLASKADAPRGIAGLFGGLFGGRKGVSIRYGGSGNSPDEAQYQILDAQDIEPGLYTLTLRVRDNLSRRTAEREKDLFVE